MAAIPEPQNTIPALIDAVHETQRQHPRPHLGASQIGHPCDRALWLSFRWAVRETFSGRMLRLFRRGHNEEATIIDDLSAIGVTVSRQQSRVHFGKHFSGSIDGIGTNIPGGGSKPHLLEFKTHSDKSFKELIKDGSLQKAKSLHWAQMQAYMLGMRLERALYIAVNKNDDALYVERVKLDKEAAQRLVERAHRITMSERMPEPISADPSWYQCRYCAGHSICHGDHLTKEVNCRTCAHVTPREDSTWHCARHDAGDIPTQFQREGCAAHVLHPDLVPWKMLDSGNPWEAVYEIDGKPVRNGEGDAFCFSSVELIAGAGNAA
jgi:CRISPR/Cas system-associated exonuclease Cas4 (RecB family)